MKQSLPTRAARCGALALVALLFAVNVYRAATQSITHDEAFTYNHCAGGDVPLDFFHANNHVLYTMLARFSVAALGLSEFTLRLPALAGGLLCRGAVYKLSAGCSARRGCFFCRWRR